MKAKIALYSFLIILGLCVFAFGLEYAGLHWMKFFNPRKENIRREVFEETKSYTHGAIADIAKYYEQYKNAETVEDKAAIKSIVAGRFPAFDANNIRSQELKQFFINMRGY